MNDAKKRITLIRLTVLVLLVFCGMPSGVNAHEPHVCPDDFPDTPTFQKHLRHEDIVSGALRFGAVFDAGERLFAARLNRCDGQGRPATTGTGAKRIADEPARIRTSAPDADACAGCHAQPRAGGSGDFVANVFVLAQAADPVITSVEPQFSNDRNTLSMFGAGPIEMLAREMSADLQAQVVGKPNGVHTLTTKGVPFEVTVNGGAVVSSRGVDTDLVVKPFHQAGVVRSIREFTVNAFNHHHGLQADERFDLNPAKGPDHDEDGLEHEITIGDITATTLYQAALATPTQVMPQGRKERIEVMLGRARFEQIGCAACHKPALVLNSPLFTEPNPSNPPGTFADVSQTVSFDMTRFGEKPRLKKREDGKIMVHAFTDLKRHHLCDPLGQMDAIRHFCNEQLAQGRPDQDGHPGSEFFITRKLWDVGDSGPYGHRGDLTTIAEAILAHGGEGRASRDAFAALPIASRMSIVAFLKTLQGAPIAQHARRAQETSHDGP